MVVVVLVLFFTTCSLGRVVEFISWIRLALGGVWVAGTSAKRLAPEHRKWEVMVRFLSFFFLLFTVTPVNFDKISEVLGMRSRERL